MDPRLLDYYNQELNYLRESGLEFSQRFPKIASRLGLHESEITDPYVERLLEGFCFLTARIRLKMDAEFPRFSQRLLEVMYPNYLAPTPSMCIVQFKPGDMSSHDGSGFQIPRGSRLREPAQPGRKTQCEFRTAHELDLLTLEVNEAGFSSIPGELYKNLKSPQRQARSALRLSFRFDVAEGKKPHRVDTLPLYINADNRLSSHLYEIIMAHTVGVAMRPTDGTPGDWRIQSKDALMPVGFAEDESLLPSSIKGFSGHRLLHEYFAFPARFNFFRLNQLGSLASKGEFPLSFEVLILLDHDTSEFEQLVDRDNFCLNCTPVINLIEMRSDRVPIAPGTNEYHLVADRTHPIDYEVFSVNAAEGFGRDNSVEAEFRPFYSSVATDKSSHGSYFSARREPRTKSSLIHSKGPRSTYIGSEVFLSLVDQNEAPFSSSLRQLGVDITATNRDLPLLVKVGTDNDLLAINSFPVSGIRILRGPSRPVPAIPEGEINWRLINQLSLNYRMLSEVSSEETTSLLSILLSAYKSLGDPAIAKHAQSILSVTLKPVTRRLPGNGPLTFGRGVQIDITVDESLFSGASAYLFGSLLEQYLARHVSINSFTEFHLHSAQRGLVGKWAPRFGTRPCA
ncbi:type VI secretion system baseplate subunit TssF [Halopseudomonas salegens]